MAAEAELAAPNRAYHLMSSLYGLPLQHVLLLHTHPHLELDRCRPQAVQVQRTQWQAMMQTVSRVQMHTCPVRLCVPLSACCDEGCMQWGAVHAL